MGKVFIKAKSALSMQQYLDILQCYECAYIWGWYVTKYTRCTNCGSENFNSIPKTWEDPFEFIEEAQKKREN